MIPVSESIAICHLLEMPQQLLLSEMLISILMREYLGDSVPAAA